MFPQHSEGSKMFMKISLSISWACLRRREHIAVITSPAMKDRSEKDIKTIGDNVADAKLVY